MKRSSRKGLFSVLVALTVAILLSFATVSAWRPEGTRTTLAIEVGSSSARMSALVGENGLVFGTSVNEPKIIWTGPGTHTAPRPSMSSWTTEGYLLIKDGTEKSLYVHPANTLFNRDHSFALRSQEEFPNRPNVTGHQAFSLIDITSKYLANLTASASSILGHNVTFVTIVLPDGQNLQIVEKHLINDQHWGNYTYTEVVNVGDGFSTTWGERNGLSRASEYLNTHGPFSEYYRKTSSAIFAFDNGMEYKRAVLVYRLGASTLEVTIRRVDGGRYRTYSSVYDTHLGGNDFNQRVVNHLLLAHKNKTGQDLSEDTQFLIQLGKEVEKAKRELSTQDSVRIEIEPSRSGGQGLSEQLSRLQFEELNMDLFNKTIAAIDQAIKDSCVYTKENIQDIIFTGGSSNIPYLQSAVQEYFGPQKKYHGLDHPENNVILGAARLGHWHFDEKHYNGDVCCTGSPYVVYGIETAGGKMFQFKHDEMYTFSTTKDNQDRVVIRVFTGDGEKKETTLDRFQSGIVLTGIAPAPKGVPRIRVRISAHDCSRYLNLNVMDVATGRINATIFSPEIRYYDYYDDDGEKIEYSTTMLESRAGLRGGEFEIEPVDELVH